MAMPRMSTTWWKSAVVYQLYPRSFAGSGGRVGTLEGIRAHLDHLEWLGVDAVWLSPFFRSPMADFGYDVADYCDVDPLFGTLDDFDRLLADAHRSGLRVLIDWVPNHTSDEHPWFVGRAVDAHAAILHRRPRVGRARRHRTVYSAAMLTPAARRQTPSDVRGQYHAQS